jgi:hypothetical protein
MDRGAILTLGIRQGSLVRMNGEIHLILSQDCDLSATPKDEPVVESILLQLEAEIPNCAEGRNARAWQFEANGQMFTARPHNLKLLDKPTFFQHFTTNENILGALSPDQLNRLKSWRSYRYVRAAWPDEFTQRLSKNKNKIEDQLINGAPEIRALLLRLNNYADLASDVEYAADIQIIFMQDPHSLDAAKATASILRTLRILSRFHSSQGIVVNDFVEVIQIFHTKYDQKFSHERVDINDLLRNTAKLLSCCEKYISAEGHHAMLDIAGEFMLGRGDIYLEDFEKYQVFTDDWMSYKGDSLEA